MSDTPTISITGIVTDVLMTKISGTNSYTFLWDTSSGTLSDGDYFVTISASDVAGNQYSGSESITFTADLTNPTISTFTLNDSDQIIKPSDAVIISVTFSEIVQSYPLLNISTNPEITIQLISSTDSTTWSYEWTPTSSVPDGNYSITVSATDIVGNIYQAGTQSITITVDSTSPTLILSDNDDDNFLAASDSVLITAVFSEQMNDSPKITIGNIINSESMIRISGTNSYTYTWDVDRNNSIPNSGIYTASIIGTDLAGNSYSGTDTIDFTIDTTIPSVQSIYSSANGSYNQTDTVTLYLVADEALTVDTSSGTPTISFDSSGTASYTTGSGTSSLTFTYTVGAGENSSDLNATALSLNSGTIKDNVGKQSRSYPCRIWDCWCFKC